MLRRNAALFVLLLASAARAGAGTVAGKVILAAAGKDRADASNAVVWIEGAHATAGAAKGEMRSASKRFEPRVIGVLERTRPWSFPTRTRSTTTSSPSRAPTASTSASTAAAPPSPRQFDQPGLVRVYCNIHPQMVGFVMVVDSDFVAVTGPDGAFRFDDVPPGPHVVKAWNEEGGEVSVPVTVQAGADDAARDPHRRLGLQAAAAQEQVRQGLPARTPARDDERY